MQSEQINELSAALAKAQGAMKIAVFDRQNPHFKNRYASLASTIEAIRKPLADNGLSITQTTEVHSGAFVLVTTLRHASGQWVASEYPLPMGAKPQDLGSALTYARRYSIASIVSIASDDDDDAEGARMQGQTASTPAPDHLITADQVESLQGMIVEVNANIAQFCKYMRIERLEQMRASDFQRAVAALEKKRSAA